MSKKLLTATVGLFAAILAPAAISHLTDADIVAQAKKIVAAAPETEMRAKEQKAAPDPGERLKQEMKAQELTPIEFVNAAPQGAGDGFVGTAVPGLSEMKAQAFKAKAAAGNPTVVTGTLTTKDYSVPNDKMYSFPVQVIESETEGSYYVSGIYGVEDSIVMNVNLSTGEVSIPTQKFYEHSTYGEVSIVPMQVKDGKYYLLQGDVKGSVDAAGTITLGTWGIMVSSMDTPADGGDPVPSQYYGRLFNVFGTSEWVVPNTTVTCYNIQEAKLQQYEMYMEQTAANEVTLYGLAPIATSNVLSARLTTDKKMVVSPQLIYNNLYYGPFYCYTANFTQDQSTGKWKASVDSRSNMVFTGDGQGEFTIPGWAIAAKSSPSSAIGYAYNEVSLETSAAITYPAVLPMAMDGAGTKESPYVVKTVADIQTIAQKSENGETFAGVHFELGNDLDLAAVSATSFAPVGSTDAPFQGKFDGKGHTINNFKADGKGFYNTAFFGAVGADGVVENLKFYEPAVTGTGNNVAVVVGKLEGTVSNVTVTRGVVDCDGELGGGIVADASDATISNCSFNGVLNTVGSGAGMAAQAIRTTITDCSAAAVFNVDGAQSELSNKECGGIVGTMLRSKVERCYVTGTINDKLGYHAMGGIAGYSGAESSISQCFNTAAISAKRAVLGSAQSASDGETNTGGLVGYISETDMTDCYNAGTIVKSDRSDHVGGLVGYLGVGYSITSGQPTVMINVSHIKNCYNSGQIISTGAESTKGLYGTTLFYNSYTGVGPIEACLGNDNVFDQQILGMSHEDWGRSTAEMLGKLPEGFSSSVWKAEAGKYPVLANVGAGTQAQEISAMPLVLRDNDNTGKVKVSFQVSPTKNVDWALDFDAEKGESATETAALKMDGANVTVKDQYANAIVTAQSKDGWGLKVYRLAVVPKLFDGEGTAADPYQLKTVADWKNLSEAVATYAQPHEGDFFAMANDINFGKTDEFKGVGFGSAYEFSGTLDGCGKTVTGLKVDAGVYDDKGEAKNTSISYTGLICVVGEKGVVKNVNIGADNELLMYRYAGPVVGLNQGLVENCRNYAEVKGMYSTVGGVVGVNYNGGTVRGCYNAGRVAYGFSQGGGIVGLNQPTALIELCQNDGKVEDEVINSVSAKATANTAGGIVGSNYGKVDRCVNNAYVRAKHTVAGIAGETLRTYDEGDITASINNGIVDCVDQQNVNRGGIAGYLTGNCVFANNYYDSSVNVNGAANNAGKDGVTGLSSSELVAGTPLQGLSADDFDFTANAYPVLKAFAAEEATKALRSIYMAFAPKQMRTNVLTDVPLSAAEGIAYTLGQSETFKLEGKTVKVTKPEGMTVASDTLVAAIGEKYVKNFCLNSVPVIFKGEGSAESPYLIEKPADWNMLADFMESSKWEYSGNHFQITNDLDFAGDSIRIVGVNGVNFNGILDGAGHTVKGYVYANNNAYKTKLQGPNHYIGKYMGLIGTLGSLGQVKNMTINGDFKAHSYVGAMVGENYGLIDNITVLGNTESLTDGYVGGVACRTYGGSVISNCVMNGTVTSKKTYACGIVYDTKLGSLVDNCVNKGTVTATTTYAVGIAYNVAGGLRNCVNEGKLASTGTISGVAFKLDVDAWMEGCINRSDIDLTTLEKVGSNITGLFSTTVKRTVDNSADGGFIKDCHNYGNLKGGGYIYGLGKTIEAGWSVYDSSNEGEITATNGYAAGLFDKVSSYSAKLETLCRIERCFNTGNVSSTNTKAAGLMCEASKYSYIADCYNTGNITSKKAGLTAAGLIGQNNGVVERCFNAGDINTDCNAAGGLVGYHAGGALDYPARLSNCFNIGNVTSTYSGTNSNGNAGGIGGYLTAPNEAAPHIVENCYNTGRVTANKRVAGLFAGAFRPFSIVRNCYNSGKIVCLEPDDKDRYYWSGTTFTNSYTYGADSVFMLAGHSNCYYDADVNPGIKRADGSIYGEFRSVPGSKKTTEQLRALEVSEAFNLTGHGGYPVLAAFAQHDAAAAGSALLLLADNKGENYENITGAIMLVAPEGAEWTAADIDDQAETQAEEPAAPAARITFDNGKAVPTALGKVLLTCTYRGYKKDFLLNVTKATELGIDSNFAGKEVKAVTFIDLQGRPVSAPAAGQLYIVRTVYTDGTMKVEKRIARD